jgi:hypothetical protein
MKKITFPFPSKKLLQSCICSMILTSLLLFFSACKKDKDVPNSFVWTYGNTSYTANFKGAYMQSMSTTPIIIAGMGTSLASSGIGPSISIPSFNAGTYTLSSGMYHILYIDDQGYYQQSVSGSVTISNNDSNGISGSFTTTLSNNVVLTGSFTRLAVSQ